MHEICTRFTIVAGCAVIALANMRTKAYQAAVDKHDAYDMHHIIDNRSRVRCGLISKRAYKAIRTAVGTHDA